MCLDVKKYRFEGGPLLPLDAPTFRSLHDDRVTALQRAARPSPPLHVGPTARLRRALGRSLVVLGARLARDPLLEADVGASRTAA